MQRPPSESLTVQTPKVNLSDYNSSQRREETTHSTESRTLGACSTASKHQVAETEIDAARVLDQTSRKTVNEVTVGDRDEHQRLLEIEKQTGEVTLRNHRQRTLTGTYQAKALGAVGEAQVTEELQGVVQGRGESSDREETTLDILLLAGGRGRRRRSWMQRWRTIGVVLPGTGQQKARLMQVLLRQLKTIST